MATYNPPTENLVIFDSSVFHSVNGDTITQQTLDANYLRFPIGQGTETIPDLVVGGGASVGGNLGVNGELVLDSTAIIQNDGTGNLIASIPSAKTYDFQIPAGFPRLTIGQSGVQINGIPLSFDSTNNLGIQPSGGFTTLTLASKNANGIVQIAVANGSNVISTPVIVNSATTTISNSTTINTLASTTQPNGTNNTSVATTAFVQSAISALPSGSTIIPYLYGFIPNQSLGASNFINIDFTNGATLNPNTYFTLRCQFQYTWTTTGGVTGLNGINPFYTNYNFLMDVYPNRVPTITAGNNNALPNGTINGNASYVMTDATYAPNGRWYWVRNYSSSTISPTSPTAITNPIFFLSNAQSRLAIQFTPPDSNGLGFFTNEVSIEIVNRSSGTSFTSSGINGFTSFYASF